MKVFSVCSGIAADKRAWGRLGWQFVGFSEIEPFPCAVLAHHYPETPNFGDMTKYHEWPDTLRFDLLAGGTPCQGFSIAGLRGGLDDPRSQLSLVFVEIAAKYRPRWLVWENVPGVLSSEGGADFATLLATLAGRDVPIPKDGWSNSGHVEGIAAAYGIAWRVLDAQFAGVPQRRRRVFIVGYLGDWRRAAAVLFESESLRGNSPPSRETGEGIAPRISARSKGGGGLGTDFDLDGGLIPETCPTLRAGGNRTGGDRPPGTDVDTADSLIPIVTAIQAGALRKNSESGPDGIGVRTDGVAYTLEARSEVQAIAFDTTQITSAANYSNPKPGAPCHPLAAGAHPPAIAFNLRGREKGAMPEVDPDNLACQRAASGGSSRSYIATQYAVRRLTPRECERLQGFPDDFTAIPRGKKTASQCADGPRYKALGNSWAVPPALWIGERIELVERMAS